MFHATIVPLDNFSSVLLQIVFYKEDGPPDDQNEGDGGARMVAHDHRDHPASFVLLRSFAKRTVLRMTKIKGTEEQELFQIIIQRIQPAPFLCKCSFAKRTVQNQGDGGARMVANDHPDDLASSVFLCSFENGLLQRGRSSG